MPCLTSNLNGRGVSNGVFCQVILNITHIEKETKIRCNRYDRTYGLIRIQLDYRELKYLFLDIRDTNLLLYCFTHIHNSFLLSIGGLRSQLKCAHPSFKVRAHEKIIDFYLHGFSPNYFSINCSSLDVFFKIES